MRTKPYGIICPISHACNMLEPRWTIPILVEMWDGSTRFNEIRRAVGNISPALLSRRLKELELHGLIERIEDPATGQVNYIRTQRAIDLEPALNALGSWAQYNIEANTALTNTDIPTLMWEIRRLIDQDELPKRQVVLQFRFEDEGLAHDTYWALVRPDRPVKICVTNPGFDVDLYIETDRVSLAAIILSRTTISREIDEGRLFLSGDALLSRTMDKWLYHRTRENPSEIRKLA